MLEVNGNTWPASVEVETVETRPVEPIYEKPWDSDGNLSAEPNVEEAVENIPPVNPTTVEVDAPYDVKGRI